MGSYISKPGTLLQAMTIQAWCGTGQMISALLRPVLPAAYRVHLPVTGWRHMVSRRQPSGSCRSTHPSCLPKKGSPARLRSDPRPSSFHAAGQLPAADQGRPAWSAAQGQADRQSELSGAHGSARQQDRPRSAGEPPATIQPRTITRPNWLEEAEAPEFSQLPIQESAMRRGVGGMATLTARWRRQRRSSPGLQRAGRDPGRGRLRQGRDQAVTVLQDEPADGERPGRGRRQRPHPDPLQRGRRMETRGRFSSRLWEAAPRTGGNRRPARA